ncbi:MAG: hypothetical protein IJH64_08160, partial [Oscillospiraceae bacterium]|nr:hypothetical protein [Oscillospiraceae bacterium]
SLSLAEARYQQACHSALGLYLAGQLAAEADYAVSVNAAETLYRTAMDDAREEFDQAVIPAYHVLLDQTDRLNQLYGQAVGIINGGGTVSADYFSDPDTELEVCFAAGTRVLMADGTYKPIEQIRPGDKVLASDHTNPENAPIEATVVRFFDNGEKEVVRLYIDREDGGRIEFVCTPSHRFYVIDKGWLSAGELESGDQCLTSQGGRTGFVLREAVSEKKRVYNFEVEGQHTYFVGDERVGVLVHNACPMCGGSKEIKVYAKKTERIPGSASVLPPSSVIDIEGIHVQECKCGTFLKPNKEALLDAGFDEYFVNVFCELTHDPLNYDEKYWAYMMECYRFGYARDIDYDLLKKLVKDPSDSRNERQYKHFVERFRLNNYARHLEYDLKTLSNKDLKELADSGYTVTCHFDGMTWTLSQSWQSVYHSRKGDGTDCFKWVSDAGHELVIDSSQQNPHLEIHPKRIGTFNYGSWNHLGKDWAPYLFVYGNYPSDKSPFRYKIQERWYRIQESLDRSL